MRMPKSKQIIGYSIGILVAIVGMLEIVVTRAALHSPLLSARVESACSCTGPLSMTTQQWIIMGLAGMFAIGILLGLGALVVTLVRTRVQVRAVVGRAKGKSPIVFNGAHHDAFTFGYLRPKIAMCEHCIKTLPADESSAILAHEAHHVRSRDPLVFLVLTFLKYTFFFVPLIKTLAVGYRTLAEIEADEDVLSREALGGVLLRLTGGVSPKVAHTALASFASVISTRIERLLNPQWRFRLQIGAGNLFALLIMVGGIGGAMLSSSHTVSISTACNVPQVSCVRPIDAHPASYYTL